MIPIEFEQIWPGEDFRNREISSTEVRQILCRHGCNPAITSGFELESMDAIRWCQQRTGTGKLGDLTIVLQNATAI